MNMPAERKIYPESLQTSVRFKLADAQKPLRDLYFLIIDKHPMAAYAPDVMELGILIAKIDELCDRLTKMEEL